jgi:hypothetical protein
MNKPVGTLIADYGAEDAAFQACCADGEARAMTLGNRGPIRFTAEGALDPEIREAYREHGFYTFTGVLQADELADIEADFLDIQSRLPVHKGAEVDAQGRPALGVGRKGLNLGWAKPLSDPVGGTKAARGRHPVKMFEPPAPAGAPADSVYILLGSLQYSDACLRAYGHPQLLAVAAAINGPDFVPFNEALWMKEPGAGASVAWHQDGWTHWDSPDLDGESHGFNLMAQLYGCTPANGLWVVPGSHRCKGDIAAMVAEAGTERLPQAVPLVCAPGDVAITNRQAIHGSFANTSRDWRVTVNMGFHRRSSVLGVLGGGIHNAPAVYDEARIAERARAIGWAIDARRRRFPDETPYAYQPHAGQTFTWNDEARAAMVDYNLLDLGI